MTEGRTNRIRNTTGSVRESMAAVLFLSPNFLGFLIFTSFPVLAAIALSLTEWDPLADPISGIRFVGLSNFAYLLGFHHEAGGWKPTDPNFWFYLYNTVFLMMAIPVSMTLSLLLALALNQKLRGVKLLRTAFFVPSVAAGVGTMMLWLWIFNPQYGVLNVCLKHLGITGPNWVLDYYWAKPALMLMGVVTGMGGTNMIIYLASLQDVPRDLYEAATIDGAGTWARFRYVTWPALLPVTFFIFTMSLIEGFQGGFDTAYVMTTGGPDGSTTTLSYYIWSEAFRYLHMGYAAAIAVVLFAIISIVTWINWHVGGAERRGEL